MINRYVCDQLEEMRAALKALNHFSLPFSKRHLQSLVEEIQTAVNRMEKHLQARDSIESYERHARGLKKQIRELKAEKRKLTEEIKEDE